MPRCLALALALVATDAFLPSSAPLRQRVAPSMSVATAGGVDYLSATTAAAGAVAKKASPERDSSTLVQGGSRRAVLIHGARRPSRRSRGGRWTRSWILVSRARRRRSGGASSWIY